MGSDRYFVFIEVRSKHISSRPAASPAGYQENLLFPTFYYILRGYLSIRWDQAYSIWGTFPGERKLILLLVDCVRVDAQFPSKPHLGEVVEDLTHRLVHITRCWFAYRTFQRIDDLTGIPFDNRAGWNRLGDDRARVDKRMAPNFYPGMDKNTCRTPNPIAQVDTRAFYPISFVIRKKRSVGKNHTARAQGRFIANDDIFIDVDQRLRSDVRPVPYLNEADPYTRIKLLISAWLPIRTSPDTWIKVNGRIVA